MDASLEPPPSATRDRWFRLMFERSADAMALFDPGKGVFIDMNEASLRAAGATCLDQVLNLPPDALAPERQPDGRLSREVTAEIVELTLARGSHRFEWMLRRLDGHEYMVEVVSTAITQGDRTVLLTVARDVGERHRIEAELRTSEERWRQLFEQSPLSIQVFAPDGTSLRINRAFRELFLLEAADLTGFNIRRDEQLIAAGMRPQIERAFRGEVAVIPPIPFELRAHSDQPARGRRWIGSTFFPVLDRHGRLSEVVCIHHDVTDRVIAETEVRALNQSLEQRIAERTAELRASEARARTLVEHAPEAIVVFDGESGRFLECNEHACGLFGLSREALLQLGPWDVSPPRQPDGRPSSEAAMQYIQRVLAGETPVFEWTHRHRDGRLIPCEVRLVSLPGEGRRLVRGSVLDNTERRHRERIQQATYEVASAVLEAEEIHQFYGRVHEIVRRLMPAENFYIALLDDATQMISFPYHVDQYTPRPGPRPITTGLTGQVLRQGKPLLVTDEMGRRKRRVQTGVVIEGVAELPYTESGRPAATWLGVPLLHRGQALGVMAVQDYRDTHAYGDEELRVLTFVAGQVALALERRRAETELRRSEEKFKSLFELSPLGISRIDWLGRFLQINPAFARMIGRTREEIMNLTYWDITPRQYEAREFVVLEEVQKHGHFGPFEKEYIHRDGHLVPIVLHAVLVRAPDGEDQLWGIVEDVTERKRAEAELLKALERERELSQLKSRFVSMVSHEFRTPLGVIQSSAEILHDYLDRLEPEERREHLVSITKNTRRMAGLMEEVLVLGRLDAGKLPFSPAPVDLRNLLLRLVDEVHSATDYLAPIELRAQELPAQVPLDEKLVTHILSNLLSNAVKYSPPGTPVQFEASLRNFQLEFRIQDRGIGIADSDQARLFEAFHRGANVGNRTGTGLGLVIVKRCVELHGGRFELKSRLGEGTTVTVRLPVLESSVEPRTT